MTVAVNERTADAEPLSRGRMVLFFLCALLLCGWHLDRGLNANTVSRAAMVAAVVEQGTLRIDAYHELTDDKALIDGHYYSDKAPLPALLLIPVYAPLVALGILGPGEHGLLTGKLLMLGGLICGSVPLALIITLCWLRIRSSPSAFSPALLAALPFLGSFLFVYSGSFNAHLLGALFLLLAFIALEGERHFVAGALCGCAVLCEYPLVLFPLAWVVWIFFSAADRKVSLQHVLRFTLGGLPLLVLMLAYNAILTGDPLSVGYQHEANYTFMHDGFGMAHPTLASLWGLTFSTYRGLFVYMPVMLLVVSALVLALRTRGLRTNAEILIPCLLSFLLIASYGMWWGGWAIGPRHLSAAAVLLAYRGLPLVAEHRWMRWPFVALSALGIGIAFIAKNTVWYSFPTEVKRPIEEILIPKLRDGAWTDMQIPVSFGMSPQTSSLAFVFVTLLVLVVLHRLDRSPMRTR
ncbi:MAG: hypothetical protein IPO12_00830 [Flavobacteriales bacterium]|nr:hypothetical protein [Flavobacteriales bacterium]